MLLFISLASAEIIITEQPDELYNLGDTIKIPIKITTLTEISELFSMKLICNGIETEVYKEYLVLSAGEEAERKPSVPLIEGFIGRSTGTCRIKALLGEKSYLTNDFTISDLIKIELKNQKTEINPGEEFAIEVEATKENEKAVNGIMEIRIIMLNQTSENIEVTDTIKKGYGYATMFFPANTKANQYLISINISEKDTQGRTTNKGFIDYNIKVLQVPTSLEIILENENIEPDTNALIKTILHDQTGEKIESTSWITIKNSKGEIMENIEKQTDEFLEIPIIYKEPPAEWSILAESNNLTSETNFQIIEKQKVTTLIINKTLIITNTGNVFYNNTVLINIENSSLNIKVNLDIDESKKYLLSAPDGEYQIEIITEEGENQIIEGVALTGKIISIKEASEGIVKIIRRPTSWVFIIIILGFLTFIILKKGYKRSFFGHINLPFKTNILRGRIPLKKDSLLATKNKAELTLSIKGDKQEVSLTCMKIKNLKEIQNKKGNAEETLQKIVDIAEKEKAIIYENQDNIFFILAPTKTKTFSNEKSALKIAQKIKEILAEHNKMFSQKINAGISLNTGMIIAKQEQEIFRFMSMGTLITTAKKIATISQGEIFLSEKTRDKLASNTKTQKQEKDGTEYYSIKEIKNPEQHKKFISNFLKRIEGKGDKEKDKVLKPS